MANKTSIEWTDVTWNPTRGCRRVSPGCENCYAEKIAHRFSGPGLPYEGLVTIGKNGPRWNGEGRFIPDALDAPMHWRQPRKVFVNSTSDLFFERFANEEIAAVFGVMAACPQHIFQALSKRIERAAQWFAWLERESRTVNAGRGMSPAAYCLAMAQKSCDDVRLARDVDRTCAQPWPLPNVWIGASVEDQQRANERLPLLVQLPAAVRFVSYEPALEAVDFTRVEVVAPKPPNGPGVWLNALTGHVAGPDDILPHHIDWLIAGGESGPGARPCAIEWIDSAREQCAEAGVPFFAKQLGSRVVSENRAASSAEELAELVPGAKWPEERWLWLAGLKDRKGGDWSEWPEELRVREFPAHRSGQ